MHTFASKPLLRYPAFAAPFIALPMGHAVQRSRRNQKCAVGCLSHQGGPKPGPKSQNENWKNNALKLGKAPKLCEIAPNMWTPQASTTQPRCRVGGSTW
eukprot:s59_g46.t1